MGSSIYQSLFHRRKSKIRVQLCSFLPAFIKRRAFEHEKEIRFVIHVPRVGLDNNSIIRLKDNGIVIPLKDIDFVEKIIIDPRLKQEKVITAKEKYKLFNVEKSTLYDVPPKRQPIQETAKDFFPGFLNEAKWWNGNDFISLRQPVEHK